MRIGFLSPLALALLAGISLQAQASSDDSCYPDWRVSRDSLDPCNNLPFLSPGNDSRANLRLLLAGEKLVGINTTAYRYRRHDEQMTVQCERDLRLFREEIALWQEAAAAAAAHGWTAAARTGRRMRFVQLHLLYYIALDLGRGELRTATQKAQILRTMRAAPA